MKNNNKHILIPHYKNPNLSAKFFVPLDFEFIAGNGIEQKILEKLANELIKSIDDDKKLHDAAAEMLQSIENKIFDKNQKPYVIELESQPGTYYYDKHEKIRREYFKNIFKILK